MRHVSSWPGPLIFLLVLGAGMSRTAPAEREDASQGPVFLPGGVADPAGKTGYVTNATGGIDAIDLEGGRLLWQDYSR